ncbi:MAG: UbiX family flavin prenyltransferase [Armatimonadaceae bacterium]
MMATPTRVILGITGASGVLYGLRSLEKLVHLADEIQVIASANVQDIIRTELDDHAPTIVAFLEQLGTFKADVHVCNPKSYFEPPASGSYRHCGMLIAPCSMGTLGRIAAGTSDDLMCRAADVCLKERRKLVLLARETPLSLIHLRNMTAVTEAGAIVLPACPSFYHKPSTLVDAIDTVVDRALAQLGLPTASKEWMK